mmetsp:Transcript_9357/g.17386  ORF Transcript_9357/g.17386 Transcript_9357/m.17386 type:complete len:537 (-) Transcript_9357:182-1792(-)
MTTIVFALAWLASTCHGHRYQMRNEATRGTSLTDRQSPQVAAGASPRHFRSPHWKHPHKDDEANTLKSLAIFLLTSKQPDVAWQVGGSSMRLLAALQPQLRPLPSQPQVSVRSAKVSHRSRNSIPTAAAEDSESEKKDSSGRLSGFFRKLVGGKKAGEAKEEKAEDAKDSESKSAEAGESKTAEAGESKSAAAGESKSAEAGASKSPIAPPPDDDEPHFEDRWLTLDMSQAEAEPQEGATTMPVFPLGPYFPYSESTLTIFEPRYRKMYDDIIFSGGRRFMVCSAKEKGGSEAISEVGVIFYLDDLREVSELTGDKIKYVGKHSVLGPVRAKKVLNPRAWRTRETYLKAEVEVIEDTDLDVDTSAAEADVTNRFKALIEGQTELNDQPRFSKEVMANINFTRSTKAEEAGLWQMVELWQSFLQARDKSLLIPLQRQMQAELQRAIKEFEIDVPPSGRVNLGDLPAELQEQIMGIQTSFMSKAEELESKGFETQIRSILGSKSHTERLSMFKYLLDTERKRVAAKAALKKMFADGEK